jgi:uncharacterized LabA/DUF88 family protein
MQGLTPSRLSITSRFVPNYSPARLAARPGRVSLFWDLRRALPAILSSVSRRFEGMSLRAGLHPTLRRDSQFRASGQSYSHGVMTGSLGMKRKAIVLIDGQNLFHAAQREFGYTAPNFDALKIARVLCGRSDSMLHQTRFYSGVPSAAADPWWHAFWANKCCQMERNNITTVTRPLSVHSESGHSVWAEKGIDLRIGLDMVRAAQEGEADLLILVSSDQDFQEAVREARLIARRAGRRLAIASAYPAASSSRHGIYQTDWLPLSAAEYALCLDPRDYRPSERQLMSLTEGPTGPGPNTRKLVPWPRRNNRHRP